MVIHCSVCGFFKKMFCGALSLRLKSLNQMVPKLAYAVGHGFNPQRKYMQIMVMKVKIDFS